MVRPRSSVITGAQVTGRADHAVKNRRNAQGRRADTAARTPSCVSCQWADARLAFNSRRTAEGRAVSAVDLAGWSAAALTMCTFVCQDMRRLRVLAIGANVAFVTYGSIADLTPVLALHLALAPINLWRLLQLRLRSPAASAHASHGSAERGQDGPQLAPATRRRCPLDPKRRAVRGRLAGHGSSLTMHARFGTGKLGPGRFPRHATPAASAAFMRPATQSRSGASAHGASFTTDPRAP